MSKIENAQTSCSLSTLALLAKGFDVPVTSLFRGADVERQVLSRAVLWHAQDRVIRQGNHTIVF